MYDIGQFLEIEGCILMITAIEMAKRWNTCRYVYVVLLNSNNYAWINKGNRYFHSNSPMADKVSTLNTNVYPLAELLYL